MLCNVMLLWVLFEFASVEMYTEVNIMVEIACVTIVVTKEKT